MSAQATQDREQADGRIADAKQAEAEARTAIDRSRQEQDALAQLKSQVERQQRTLSCAVQMEQEAQAAGQPLAAYLEARLLRLREAEQALERKQAAAQTVMSQAEQKRAEADALRAEAGQKLDGAAAAEQRAAGLEQQKGVELAAARDARQELEQEGAAVKEEHQRKLAEIEARGKQQDERDQQQRAREKQQDERDQQQQARGKQQDERDQKAAQRELVLAEREQGLDGREQALGGMEAEVARKEEAVLRREQQVAVNATRVRKQAYREMRVDCAQAPMCLDEALEAVRQSSIQVAMLCEMGRGYIQRDKGLLEGSLYEVRSCFRAARAAFGQVDRLTDEVAEYYKEYRWEELRVFNEETDAEDGDGGGGGAPPAAPGPGGGPPPAAPSPASGPRAAAPSPASDGTYNVNSMSVAGPVQVPSVPPNLQKLYPGGLYTGGHVVLRGVSPADGPKVPIEAVLGSGPGEKSQWGLFALSKQGGGVFIDINEAQVFSIYGLQKYGKTSSILTLVEMMMSSKRRIGQVPAPLGGVWAHFGKGTSYPPGIVKARYPNQELDSIRFLTDKLGALPEGIKAQMEVFVPPMLPEQLAERRAQFPGLAVECLEMTVEDFGIIGIRQFMLATDNSAMYMSTLDQTLRGLSVRASLEQVEAALEAAEFTPQGRRLMEARWSVLRPYLMGKQSIRHRLKPGVLLILDIRNEWITEREAMALFTVLMNTFSLARDDHGNDFLKFMVFDEAYKYMAKGTVSTDIVEMIKEMRHRFMTVIIATQDPESVEFEVHKLSTVTIVHKTRSIKSLNVLRQGNAAWEAVTIEQLSAQQNGEAFIAAASASVPQWEQAAQPVRVRPTCAQPGGTSRTATGSAAGD